MLYGFTGVILNPDPLSDGGGEEGESIGVWALNKKPQSLGFLIGYSYDSLSHVPCYFWLHDAWAKFFLKKRIWKQQATLGHVKLYVNHR